MRSERRLTTSNAMHFRVLPTSDFTALMCARPRHADDPYGCLRVGTPNLIMSVQFFNIFDESLPRDAGMVFSISTADRCALAACRLAELQASARKKRRSSLSEPEG
jgi:hypothetical protein